MKRSLFAAATALLLGVGIYGVSSSNGASAKLGNEKSKAETGKKEKLEWLTDPKVAFAAAKAEDKQILIDFTGTTWCPSCIALEKEVFTTQKFADYSKKFVLLKVDFPDPISVPDKALPLIEKYLSTDIMLPTAVVLSPKGEKLGQTLYGGGGPDRYIGDVEKIAKKQ